MATIKTIEKVETLEYDEAVTLAVIETDEMLSSIFVEMVSIPFKMLHTLSKKNKLSEDTKKVLNDVFESLICTNEDIVGKYKRLSGKGTATPKVVEPVQEIVTSVVEPKKRKVVKVEEIDLLIQVNTKLPRRYGKEKITKDIAEQGGKATPLQRALISIYDIRNIHCNLALRGIQDMFGNGQNFSEEDCRKITSMVKTLQNQVDLICKKN
jgi:hypothetical protein